MKNLLTPPGTLALAVLLGAWGCASAESLGRASAEAWLGQPLQVTVPARFDSPDPADQCIHADVFYGPTRVPADRVQATLLGVPRLDRRVRIEARVPVDEPVVTVALRAGCRNTVTRQYTLLPELPSDAVLARLAQRGNAVAAAPLRLETSAPVAPAARSAPRRASRPVMARATPPAHPRAAKHTAKEAAPPPAVAARGPRLRLEPLEIDAQPYLRTSASLADPAGDPARRAAAARLWQALNADPQEVLRTSVLLHQLQTELVQLRQDAGRTHAEVAALRQRLDSEQRPWLPTAGVIQALLALLAAAGVAAAALWLRGRRADARDAAWAAAVANEPVPASGAAQAADATEEAQPAAVPAPRWTPAQPVAVPAAAAVDFTLPEPVARSAQPRATSGALRVETLAATFEEVEFLASLGLASDAADVLKTYVEDSAGPAPLAFFELMRLADADGDAHAVAAVRRRYAQVFGVEAPPLAQLTAARGADSLPALSAALTAAWQGGDVLQVIEDALFQVPPPGASFTLQAGRDLLSLYDLALGRVIDAAAAEGDAHPLAPWADAENAAAALHAAQAAGDATGGLRFALDVDLGAAPEPLAERAVRPDERAAALLAEKQLAAARESAEAAEAQRAAREAEDAFSAAVAFERVPAGRY